MTGINNLQFSDTASASPVSDASFPGVSAAFNIATVGAASGLNQYFEGDFPQKSRRDATFEVVFHVSDTAAGNEQVLLDVGATRGVSFILDEDTLRFNVDGDGATLTLSDTLANGWHHAVGVVDLVGTSDDASNDSITLYVNNVEVGSLDNVLIDDWAGGNVSGIGGDAAGTSGVNSPVNYHGQIAVARYYNGVAFAQSEVEQNFDALTAVELVGTTMSALGSLVVDPGSILELDISDSGQHDLIALDGSLVANGGTLSVVLVGAGALDLGDQWDLFDFAASSGQFSSLLLPALGEGMMWNATQLMIDGALSVTIAGDFNGDGIVDASDYTVWRDQLGSSVSPLTGADGDGDGVVGAGDFDLWQQNFGQSIASGQPLSVGVPEPMGIVGIWSGMLSIGMFRRGSSIRNGSKQRLG